MNLSHKLSSVAISVLSTRTVCVSEFYHRDGARTEPKCPIMVKAIPTIKKEVPDPDDQPDYGNPKDDIKEAWRLEYYEEIERNIRTTVKKQGVHSVDPIAVMLKANPSPIKDLLLNWLNLTTEGWYGGNNIIETLSRDEFEAVIDGTRVVVSRWALINVPNNLSNQAADIRAQTERTHGQATIKAARETAIPSEFLVREEERTPRPIIGIRVFHGGPSQAMKEWVYQSY